MNLVKSEILTIKNEDDLIKENSSKSEQINPIELTKVIKIGTRKSKLAMIQAELVKEHLNRHYNNADEIKYEFQLIPISTKGDKILDVPLSNIGSKALFTKELEIALLDNEIDLIVHSCKDLPTNLPAGLCISAILREIADDVLVVKKGLEDKFKNVSDFLGKHHLLFEDKAIGTSSLRRIAQLKRINSQIKIEDIRGNIDTRLNKLDAEDSPYSALVLAGAGLRRGGFGNRITAILNENWWYAVGQGALAIECREGDEFIQGLLHKLIDEKTTFQVLAERSFMQYLEGGCSVPLGVRSEFILEHNNGNEIDKRKNDEDENVRRVKRIKTDNYEQNAQNESTKDTIDNLGKDLNNQPNNQSKEQVHTSDHSNDKLEDNLKIENNEINETNLKEILNLKLSGTVISLDGQQFVQFDCQLKDVDLNSINSEKIDCTKIVLPTRDCPRQNEIQEQYYSCAKLGIHLAKQLQNLGAKTILDEINKNRKPVN